MKTSFTCRILVFACCLTIAGGISAAGCGDDGHGGTDGDTDAEEDTGIDTGADTDVDTATDADVDTATDPYTDADADIEDCIDVDNDGYCRPADCDDENAAINPGRSEVCGNAFDDNCDGVVDEGCLEGTTGYYVDKDSVGGPCSDSNPGTLTDPWCTIDKANETLTAGDTVFIRAGTYSGETIQPADSGLSESERIAYTNYNGETVTLEGSVYCIRLQEKSYVTIRDLKFLDCERNLYLSASSHNNIGYCEFDNPGGPVTWAGSRIYDGSQYNRIHNCTFSRYGNESYYGGSYQDSGCILDIGNDNEVDNSDYNLVTDSTFFYGGHHILGVYAEYNVVRRNTFHNEEWYECHRPSIGGFCGNRDVILNSSYPDSNIRNIIEDNMIVFSGVPPDQDSSVGLSLRTQHNIVRRNIFYHNDSSGVALSNDGGNSNNASNNYIYHNTFYHNGYTLLNDWDPTKSGMLLARWVDDAAHNAMTGVAIKNNIFHDNQLYAVYYYYVEQSEQFVENNWEEEGDPGFVSISGTADPFDFAVFDFHLQAGSPCVDSGGYLTRTTNDAADGTELSVEEAGYFTDGNALVEGDMIQIEGRERAVTITDVDYETGTITIDTALSWTAGTGVGLPYFGAGPDQGACEREP